MIAAGVLAFVTPPPLGVVTAISQPFFDCDGREEIDRHRFSAVHALIFFSAACHLPIASVTANVAPCTVYVCRQLLGAPISEKVLIEVVCGNMAA